MEQENFTITAQDGTDVHCYRWVVESPRGVVQIVHGGAEHAGRYARLARKLNDAGYVVYAEDHRGHGHTAVQESDLGDMGPANGLVNTCADVAALSSHIRNYFPQLPLIILGHSIGSLITQRVLIEHGGLYTGAVLSGSPSVDVIVNAQPLMDAALENTGRDGPGDELQMQIFASFLDGLGEIRTPFDWLSRDPAEVDRYIEDPLCGFALRVGAWQDIAEAAKKTRDEDALAAIPSDLPMYIFSGADDPVHDRGRAIHQLLEQYARAGVSSVEKRLYDGGRHEMFNEINRDEVTNDLIAWLERQVAA